MTDPALFLQDGSKQCPLAFGEATGSLLDACNELAAKALNGPITEQYHRREQMLARTPLMRDGGRRIWCLYKTDRPEEVVASCRIIRRQLLVRKPGGGVTTERGYAIAGVCTEARFRGQGLAGIVMRKVAEWLDSEGQAYGSLLWSIIGAYYVKHGWDMLPSLHATMAATGEIPMPGDVPGLPSTRPILKHEVPALCDLDVQQLVHEWSDSDGTSTSNSAEETLVTVLPDADTVTYLHSLADFFGREQHIDEIPAKGAICEASSSWMYWYHEFKCNRLVIQRLKPASPTYERRAESTTALLLDALREAKKYNLAEVSIWSPTADVHEALAILRGVCPAMKMEAGTRDSRLSCIRFRGGVNEDRAALLGDEFYAWN